MEWIRGKFRLQFCVQFSVVNLFIVYFVLLLIVFARMPLRQVPDALFVSDGFAYYIYLPSLLIDHDLDFTNQLTRLPYEGTKVYFKNSQLTNKPANPFPVGCAVLWFPFFLFAHIFVFILSSLGISLSKTGFGLFYELPVYIGSFTYGILGLWIMRKTLNSVFSKQISDICFFVILFTTPYLNYLWIEPNMSHIVSMFLISIFIFLIYRSYLCNDSRFTSWIARGIVLGLIALVRPNNVIIGVLAVPVLLSINSNIKIHNKTNFSLRRLTLFSLYGLFALLIFSPQIFVWKSLYGSYFLSLQNTGYDTIHWLQPDLIPFLLSFYLFAPFLLPGTIGFLCHLDALKDDQDLHKKRRDFIRQCSYYFLLVILAAIYLCSQSGTWIGESYGQRRMVDWSGLLAIGLGMFLTRFTYIMESRWTKLVVISIALINICTLIIFCFGHIPHWGAGKWFLEHL